MWVGWVAAAGLAGIFAASPPSTGDDEAQSSAEEEQSEEQSSDAEVERLREEAQETMLRGEFERARREFEAILKLVPQDASAQRDAARAASAAGQFEEAAAALERAHHFEHHTPDPEVHYLRGEALYVLERTAEAQREHKIAELEIGKAPTQRMPKLWLARIYARRGYVVLAHAMYESMLPPPPKFDTEVALNQADAHLMNKDWTGGAEVLHRYLALDPKNVRGREMLAWALEASGDIIGELAVRQELAAEMPTAGYRRDYGRALERATSFRAARDEYGGAIKALGSGPDAALITSYQQMRYRSSPELAAGFQVRTDPQAWAWRLQTGASLPVKSRHQFAALAWHDNSTDWRANQVVGANTLSLEGTVTGLGLQGTFVHRTGAWLMAGADGRFMRTTGTDAQGNNLFGPESRFTGGAQLEADSAAALKYAQIGATGLFNEQWNDAPITVHEGGTASGGAARLFLFPKSRILLGNTGFQILRLGLAPQATSPAPTGMQYLGWAGIDFNLWANPKRLVRGEAMDDRMVRRTYMVDSGVLAYRHFELWNDLGPDFRISLAPRGSTDIGTFVVRKVFFGGRAGIDLHGGGGYDNQRQRAIAQGGGALLLAPSWSTRLQLTYDMSHETLTGIPGTLQIAWLTFHVDI